MVDIAHEERKMAIIFWDEWFRQTYPHCEELINLTKKKKKKTKKNKKNTHTHTQQLNPLLYS